MAQAAQTTVATQDSRFYYEPLLSPHPRGEIPSMTFADHSFNFPMWISSMTGGTEKARIINRNMAQACEEFELGMGLGSCRPLLDGRQEIADFDVRDLMPNRPLYANIGVAQVEELKRKNKLNLIHEMVAALKATGLIIHVNPLQEWFQPGGDIFLCSPIETITEFVTKAPYPIMVKEVGHGMGPASLKALMQLPLMAIEFAAFGGTNFSVLESRRAGEINPQGLSHVGHSAEEMVGFVQNILRTEQNIKCRQFIISGGVKDVLQGHALTSQLPGHSLFGMAANVLAHAQGEYEELRIWIKSQLNQYAMARSYLTAKPFSEGKI